MNKENPLFSEGFALYNYKPIKPKVMANPEKEINKFHIKFCVVFTMTNRDKEQIDSFRNFEDKEVALRFYEELLCNENLYTANFCEVIETTG